MREAFYLAYDAGNCEYIKLHSKDIDDRLKNGPPMVSANLVIPYPPGFPILVPGQVVSAETITYIRKLDEPLTQVARRRVDADRGLRRRDATRHGSRGQHLE